MSVTFSQAPRPVCSYERIIGPAYDITAEMHPGEMIWTDGFTLQDAMSALEVRSLLSGAAGLTDSLNRLASLDWTAG